MLGFPPCNTEQPPRYMSQEKGENKEENDTGKLIEKKLKDERYILEAKSWLFRSLIKKVIIQASYEDSILSVTDPSQFSTVICHFTIRYFTQYESYLNDQTKQVTFF